MITLHLRLVALAAIIVAVLSNTACTTDNDAPYIPGTPYNKVLPLQKTVAEIEPIDAKCAPGLTTVQLSTDDEKSLGSLTFHTRQLDNQTVFVSSSEGFESVAAGIVITENGTRKPFSTNGDGFMRDALSFIAQPEDFGTLSISAIDLCVNRP